MCIDKSFVKKIICKFKTVNSLLCWNGSRLTINIGYKLRRLLIEEKTNQTVSKAAIWITEKYSYHL